MRKLLILFLLLPFLLLQSCGGGGGGDTGRSSAVMKFSASSTPVQLYGVQLDIDLPSWITVKLKGDGTTADGVIRYRGSATGDEGQFMGYYSSGNSKLTVATVSAVGFGSGETVEIRLDIEKGHIPKESDFTFAVKGWDENGAEVALNPTITVSSQ